MPNVWGKTDYYYLNIKKGQHNSCDKGKLKCQKCGQKLPDLPHIRHWLIFWVGLPVSLLLGAFCAIITSLLLKSLLGESRNITMLFVTVSLISGTALGIFLINKLLSRWLWLTTNSIQVIFLKQRNRFCQTRFWARTNTRFKYKWNFGSSCSTIG